MSVQRSVDRISNPCHDPFSVSSGFDIFDFLLRYGLPIYSPASYRTERINTYYECQYNVQWTEQLVLSYLLSEPQAILTLVMTPFP
jgi:hypothetical protein